MKHGTCRRDRHRVALCTEMLYASGFTVTLRKSRRSPGISAFIALHLTGRLEALAVPVPTTTGATAVENGPGIAITARTTPVQVN